MAEIGRVSSALGDEQHGVDLEEVMVSVVALLPVSFSVY